MVKLPIHVLFTFSLPRGLIMRQPSSSPSSSMDAVGTLDGKNGTANEKRKRYLSSSLKLAYKPVGVMEFWGIVWLGEASIATTTTYTFPFAAVRDVFVLIAIEQNQSILSGGFLLRLIVSRDKGKVVPSFLFVCIALLHPILQYPFAARTG